MGGGAGQDHAQGLEGQGGLTLDPMSARPKQRRDSHPPEVMKEDSMSDSSSGQQEPDKVATPEDDTGGDIVLLRCAGCGKHMVSIAAVHPTFIADCSGWCEFTFEQLPTDTEGERFVVCVCCSIAVCLINELGHSRINRAALRQAWASDEISDAPHIELAVAKLYLKLVSAAEVG